MWSTLTKDWSSEMREKPRFTATVSRDAQLHVFIDASTTAYAAAVYMQANNHEMFLIFAKSRIALIKGLTILRLELLAILIGVRAVQFVMKQMELVEARTTLWTDSQCALEWIKTDSQLPSTKWIRLVRTIGRIVKEITWLKLVTKERGILTADDYELAIHILRKQAQSEGLTENEISNGEENDLEKREQEQEFITLILEIEGILNTRPLTYVNFDESIVLRPIDFIIPNAPLIMLADAFWNTWRDEYLKERTQREHKFPRYVSTQAPGEEQVILVNEPEIPRGMQKVEKIKKIHK
ncbi:unnamed protein product, partial [Litomosoides sigmodontis]